VNIAKSGSELEDFSREKLPENAGYSDKQDGFLVMARIINESPGINWRATAAAHVIDTYSLHSCHKTV
jgi:hypothetical protein